MRPHRGQIFCLWCGLFQFQCLYMNSSLTQKHFIVINTRKVTQARTSSERHMMLRRTIVAVSASLISLGLLTACSGGAPSGPQTPRDVRVVGTIVTINIPDATDSYVAFEVLKDESTDVTAYFCNGGQPVCRLLKVGNRISFSALTNGYLYVDNVTRVP